eukprot:Opistho-2@62353
MGPIDRAAEDGAERLIAAIAGLENPSENFTIAKNFVLSNFKYHRFLDADSHKINRTYEGLVEKFEIHAQYDKAEALSQLLNRLKEIRTARLSGVAEKLSVHYPTLSLLSLLANAPTEIDYEPSPRFRPPTDEEAAFDWAAELRQDLSEWSHECDLRDDDEGDDHSASSESDEGGDDSDYEGNDAEIDVIDASRVVDGAPHGYDGLAEDDGDVRMRGLMSGAALRECADRAIVRRYWEAGNADTPLTVSATSLCARLAAHRLAQSGLPRSLRPSVVLRERELVAEVLWMLGGAPTHAFGGAKLPTRHVGHASRATDNENGASSAAGGLAILPGLCLAEVSDRAVASVCDVFVGLASTVRSIEEFCAFATRGWYGLCHQAYAASATGILEDYRAELSRLERHARHGGLSLICLKRELAPVAHRIRLLSRTTTECVLPHESPADNANRASFLMTSLMGLLCELDIAMYAPPTPPNINGDADTDRRQDDRRVVLRLLCDSARPYLAMLDEWMGSGTVSADPYSEFAVTCDPAMPASSSTYWSHAVSVRDVPRPYPRGSNAGNQPALRNHEAQPSPTAACGVPAFLLPRLHEVVLAGKSMRLLRHMDERHGLGTQQTSEQSHEKEPSRERLGDAFVRMMTAAVEGGVCRTQQQQAFKDAIPTSRSTAPVGVQLASFLDAVTALYVSTCGRLLRRLEDECLLSAHLGALTDVYLMAAGGAMHEFSTAVFEKIEAGENWRDPTFLAASLQHAIALRGRSSASRLSTLSLSNSTTDLLAHAGESRGAHVSDASESATDPFELFDVSADGEGGALVETLDALRLHFHVQWPLEFIVDRAAVDEYNRAFGFMLRMKRAKWTLERLRWKRGAPTICAPAAPAAPLAPGSRVPMASSSGAPYAPLQHPLRLLRAKLLHFTNTLHTHIVTRVLHSEGLEFRSAVARASDLDEVIAAHRTYISTVIDRCLLGDKVAMVRDAITKMLNLTLVFASLWGSCAVSTDVQSAGGSSHNPLWTHVTGVHRQPMSPCEALAEVGRIDGEYTRFVRFVVSLIGGIIRRGAHPHLEALIISLGTTNAL